MYNQICVPTDESDRDMETLREMLETTLNSNFIDRDIKNVAVLSATHNTLKNHVSKFKLLCEYNNLIISSSNPEGVCFVNSLFTQILIPPITAYRNDKCEYRTYNRFRRSRHFNEASKITFSVVKNYDDAINWTRGKIIHEAIIDRTCDIGTAEELMLSLRPPENISMLYC